VKSGMSQPTWIPQLLTILSPEFRRHKETTNPAYIMGFLSQWKVYLDEMPQDPNVKFRGKKLDATSFEKVCSSSLLLAEPYSANCTDVIRTARPAVRTYARREGCLETHTRRRRRGGREVIIIASPRSTYRQYIGNVSTLKSCITIYGSSCFV
jgi:hypothetical protein